MKSKHKHGMKIIHKSITSFPENRSPNPMQP